MFCGSCEICSAAAAAAGPMAPHLTIAKTPTLVSKTRTRKVTARSQLELEDMEVEEMKKYVELTLMHSIFCLHLQCLFWIVVAFIRNDRPALVEEEIQA